MSHLKAPLFALLSLLPALAANGENAQYPEQRSGRFLQCRPLRRSRAALHPGSGHSPGQRRRRGSDRQQPRRPLQRPRGRYKDAEPLYHRAAVTLAATMGPDSAEYAVSLYNLAELQRKENHYPEAESNVRKALLVFSKDPALKIPAMPTASISSRASTTPSGATTRLSHFLRQALAIREAQQGREWQRSRLRSHGSRRRLQNAQKKYAEAGKQRQARYSRGREKPLGPAHPSLAAALNGLAQVLYPANAQTRWKSRRFTPAPSQFWPTAWAKNIPITPASSPTPPAGISNKAEPLMQSAATAAAWRY